MSLLKLKTFFILVATLLLSTQTFANDYVDFSIYKDNNITVEWDTKENYYIDSISVLNDEKRVDFKRNEQQIIIEYDNLSPENVQIQYVGCLKESLCQPEQHFIIENDKGVKQSKSFVTSFWESLSDPNEILDFLSEKDFLVSLGIFLLLGMLLAFTPCIFPMLPIVSSLVIHNNKHSSLLVSFCYALGIALSYALIGLIMGIININVQIYLQSTSVLWGISLFFFILGALMLSNYQWKFLQGSNNFFNQYTSKINPDNPLSVLLIGFFSSLVISPCAAAPIVGVLIFIQTQQHLLYEQVLILFTLGFGAGIPLILMATSLKRFLPSTGQWMNTIKHIFALILFMVGVYTFQKTISIDITPVYFILIMTYIFYLCLSLSQAKVVLFYALSVILAFSYPYFTNSNNTEQNNTPKVEYQTVESMKQLNKALDKANNNNKPVFVDIYADWCATCIQMNNGTLSVPNIVETLNEEFKTIKVDLSDINDEKQKILDHYALQTAPAYIFYNRNGQKDDNYYIGYIEKNDFSDILKEKQ